MRTIKTYFKEAPFYNAFLRPIRASLPTSRLRRTLIALLAKHDSIQPLLLTHRVGSMMTWLEEHLEGDDCDEAFALCRLCFVYA